MASSSEHLPVDRTQLLWGVALFAAGIGVFFRIPQVMPQLAAIDAFKSSMGFVRGSFYLLGILLVMGGGRKLIQQYRRFKGHRPDGDETAR